MLKESLLKNFYKETVQVHCYAYYLSYIPLPPSIQFEKLFSSSKPGVIKMFPSINDFSGQLGKYTFSKNKLVRYTWTEVIEPPEIHSAVDQIVLGSLI